MTEQDLKEVHAIVEKAIARHNRNASIISAILGLTVLGFYSDGLIRVVHLLTN